MKKKQRIIEEIEDINSYNVFVRYESLQKKITIRFNNLDDFMIFKDALIKLGWKD